MHGTSATEVTQDSGAQPSLGFSLSSPFSRFANVVASLNDALEHSPNVSVRVISVSVLGRH
jgi:hypothetical protein